MQHTLPRVKAQVAGHHEAANYFGKKTDYSPTTLRSEYCKERGDGLNEHFLL